MVHLNLTMPAEWEPHESTWLTWPQNEETWMGKIQEAQDIWIQMIKALHKGEIINLCVNNESTRNQVLEKLSQGNIDLNQVKIHIFPTNDAWIRDYGPIYVKSDKNQKILLNWEFNMWGGKYPPWEDDNQIPSRIQNLQKLDMISPGMILEGGSIEVNGDGVLITTESCLLNQNRNPHLSKIEIEKYLKHYFGIQKIIWLKAGIKGDDTDGHIDDITRFINPHTIVTCIGNQQDLDQSKILNQNLDIISQNTDIYNNNFKIITLPMPDLVEFKGEVLPASYANFYIGNEVVLLPIFDCSQDQIVINIFEKHFSPQRKVIPILAKDLVIGLGGIHCVTQQEPTSIF